MLTMSERFDPLAIPSEQERAPVPTPSSSLTPRNGRVVKREDGDDEPVAVVTRLSDIPPRDIEWLYPHRVPMGMVTVIAGDPASGKSTVVADWISRVTRGISWPDMQGEPNPVGGAILIAGEDALSETVRKRIDKSGGDPSRVYIFQGVRRPQCDYVAPFMVDADLRRLDDELIKRSDVRMVVIDTLDSHLGDSVNTHRKSEVQAELSRLSDFAERHHVAVIGVMHLRKQSGERALYQVLGSLGFVSSPRSVLAVSLDHEDRAKRLLTCVKLNIAKEPPGLAFRIEDDGGIGVVHWLADSVDMTADEALKAETPKARTARDDAAGWLLELLALGPMHSDRIKELAEEEGIAWRTLRRAKDDLGIRATKKEDGWHWLPPKVATGDK